MNFTVQAAQDYINAHRNEINPKYRMGFHAMPPVGWINDPNGMCYFKGEYHLFGQYHPYSTQ